MDLNKLADDCMAANDREGVLRCVENSLSKKKLVECIYFTKRYDLLPSICKAPITGALACNIYLDLLLAKDRANYITFRETFPIETQSLIEVMVERNVSIFSVDHDFSNKDITDYFIAILRADNRLLFELFREGIFAKLSKDMLDTILFSLSRCSINILQYLCEKGEYQTIALKCFTGILSGSLCKKFEPLLHWICSHFDCQSLLQAEFRDFACWSKKRWDLLFSIGIQPTEEQKEQLKTINPGLYKVLFVDDV